MTENITINKQSSICIRGSKTLYFDPLGIGKESHDADAIFITHDHGDHFSPGDIRKLLNTTTKLIAPERMRKQVLRETDVSEKDVTFVEPGQVIDVPGAYLFQTIPAYNKIKPYHPKKSGWCGYVVVLDDIRYYVAGDMDDTKDAREVRCDVALIPIGGTFTMNPREAAGFINAIKPKVAIPTHYGSIVGNPGDGKTFRDLVEDGIEVVLKL